MLDALYTTDTQNLNFIARMRDVEETKFPPFNIEKFFKDIVEEYKKYGSTKKMPSLKYYYDRQLT